MNRKPEYIFAMAMLLAKEGDREFLSSLSRQVLCWQSVDNLWRGRGLVGPMVDRVSTLALNSLLPTDMWSRMQVIATCNQARNRTMLTDLTEIGELAHGESIDILVVKGGALLACFPQATHRHLSDLDVLVRPADCDRAADLLMRNGYVDVGPSEYVDHAGRPRTARGSASHHHPYVLRSQRHTAVDVHHYLPAFSRGRPNRTFDDLWRDATQSDRTGIKVLDGSLLTLHLCHHVLVQSYNQPKLLPRHLLDMELLESTAPQSISVALRDPALGPLVSDSLELLREVRRANLRRNVKSLESLSKTVFREPFSGSRTSVFHFKNLPRRVSAFRRAVGSEPGQALRRVFPARAFLAQKYRLHGGLQVKAAHYVQHWLGMPPRGPRD